jgi:lysophospholipase L1-like esterase
VDTATAGTYTVKYNVSDAAGNAANEVSRTIVVGDGGEVTADDTYVAFGDSITNGHMDDTPDDGIGYMPILKNLLVTKYSRPHEILNAAVDGETSAQGLARIDEILANNSNANKYLIIYGTNDSAPWHVDSDGDGIADAPISKATYKSNMQSIIDKIVDAGKTPIIAKIPRVLGGGSGDNYYANDSIDEGIRNVAIRGYNEAIAELINDNGLTTSGPDFYNKFTDTYPNRDSGGYADPLHPNGAGYNSMANWWNEAL